MPSSDAGLSQPWMMHLPNTSPSYDEVHEGGVRRQRLADRLQNQPTLSVAVESGRSFVVVPGQPHVVVLLGEVHGGAQVVGVPSRGFHGYGVMEGAARTSARRHYWLWVMERRRQPKNKKRAPAMVMELGRGERKRLRVTQHGYENVKIP